MSHFGKTAYKNKSATPCQFFNPVTKSGCRNGNLCPFSHGGPSSNYAQQNQPFGGPSQPSNSNYHTPKKNAFGGGSFLPNQSQQVFPGAGPDVAAKIESWRAQIDAIPMSSGSSMTVLATEGEMKEHIISDGKNSFYPFSCAGPQNKPNIYDGDICPEELHWMSIQATSTEKGECLQKFIETQKQQAKTASALQSVDFGGSSTFGAPAPSAAGGPLSGNSFVDYCESTILPGARHKASQQTAEPVSETLIYRLAFQLMEEYYDKCEQELKGLLATYTPPQQPQSSFMSFAQPQPMVQLPPDAQHKKSFLEQEMNRLSAVKEIRAAIAAVAAGNSSPNRLIGLFQRCEADLFRTLRQRFGMMESFPITHPRMLKLSEAKAVCAKQLETVLTPLKMSNGSVPFAQLAQLCTELLGWYQKHCILYEPLVGNGKYQELLMNLVTECGMKVDAPFSADLCKKILDLFVSRHVKNYGMEPLHALPLDLYYKKVHEEELAKAAAAPAPSAVSSSLFSSSSSASSLIAPSVFAPAAPVMTPLSGPSFAPTPGLFNNNPAAPPAAPAASTAWGAALQGQGFSAPSSSSQPFATPSPFTSSGFNNPISSTGPQPMSFASPPAPPAAAGGNPPFGQMAPSPFPSAAPSAPSIPPVAPPLAAGSFPLVAKQQTASRAGHPTPPSSKAECQAAYQQPKFALYCLPEMPPEEAFKQ